MAVNFTSRAQLYSYRERRVMPNVEYYSRAFLGMGDIFTPDPYGVYNELTGECIADFGRGPYSLERGRKIMLYNLDDFENARGDIYNHYGQRTLKQVNLRRIPIATERPIHIKALDAGMSCFAEVLQNHYDYVQIDKRIKPLKDCVYLDNIMEVRSRSRRYRDLEMDIFKDLQKFFTEEDEWKEMYVGRHNGVCIVDVQLDIRLKDYYERRFERELAEEARREEELENTFEGHRIQCT